MFLSSNSLPRSSCHSSPTQELENILRTVQDLPHGGFSTDFVLRRELQLCTQNAIDLKATGADDIWHYCNKMRGPSWGPNGATAWKYKECILFVQCWLYAKGCSDNETASEYIIGDFGVWWPVLIGLPYKANGDQQIFSYTCPALAATSSKCWRAHRSRLRLRYAYETLEEMLPNLAFKRAGPGPPPPPTRPPPTYPPLVVLFPPLLTGPPAHSLSVPPAEYNPGVISDMARSSVISDKAAQQGQLAGHRAQQQ